MERRLVELECRHVEQEAAIDALSDIIASQQSQIDSLTHNLAALDRKIANIGADPDLEEGALQPLGQEEMGFDDW